ncbi:putative snurportin-1 [Helianthus anomalus]
MNNKLVESGAREAPSTYHRYRFSLVPVYSYYQMGNILLVLVWEDESCSQYVIETDNNGQVPNQQQSGKVHRAYAFTDSYSIGKVHRACTFADSYSKIVFQYMVRHSPLRIEHLFASNGSPSEQEINEVEMVG